MNDPLEGIRVLDLSRLLPGGYASLLLADLGADVIKVEEPGRGDYLRWTPPMAGEQSAGHLALNRNKRSVTINLKNSDGSALFADLAERSDVLIESFRPGVMDRLRVGYQALAKRNPRLVYCAITGYGQDGPRAQVAGHDANYLGYAGVLSITGPDKSPPVLPGVQIGDFGGGGMAAVIAILAGLQGRASSGRGTFCDVSMLDGATSWLGFHLAAYIATGEVPQRGQMPLSGGYPCYRIYEAADGYVTVGALEPQFWQALCKALAREDLADDGYAVGERGAQVIAELESLLATKTRGEWMVELEGLDVCVGPVNDFNEVLADEQLRARGMLVDEDVAGVGAWTSVGNPIRLGDERGGVRGRSAPALGEHTDEVLTELGLDSDRIADLRAAGAV